VGYSKGAPDIQEALANDSQARDSVAAFISVAGAIGGSPIAEAMPSIVQRYTSMLKLGTCDGDVSLGLQESFRRRPQSLPARRTARSRVVRSTISSLASPPGK